MSLEQNDCNFLVMTSDSSVLMKLVIGDDEATTLRRN